MNIFIFLFFSSFSFGSGSVQLGTYAGAPIVHDTVAFQLQGKGKAIVTVDYFNSDGSRNIHPKQTTKGKWSYKEPFVTIEFGKFKDKLREESCAQVYPCFKFEKSENKGLSPLNVPYGFGLR